MKKVLITGGNQGLGKATAKLFRDRGYHVSISGRDAQKLRQTASELGIDYFVADMQKIEALQELANELSDGLDVLVNNAAMGEFKTIDNVTPSDLLRMFQTNLFGPFFLIKFLIGALERRKGSVVNISSIATMNGILGLSAYSGTKAAIEGLTRSLAIELAPKGIRVNAIAPGSINTPKFGMDAEKLAYYRERAAIITPLGRQAEPEEVAQVILAQAEATFVTGATWVVDGGRSLFEH